MTETSNAGALAERGYPARAVVDMKYPEALAKELPVLINAAHAEAESGR